MQCHGGPTKTLDASGVGEYTASHVRPQAGNHVRIVPRQDENARAIDDGLVARLLLRDVQALELLYERHARALFSLALKMLAEVEAAEEVVQETFLKLWQRPEAFAPERGRLVSWLLGVAHHRAVDRLRRRRLELRYSTDYRLVDIRDGPPGPEEALLDSLRGDAIVRALQTLPEAQRRVVDLAYVGGLTQVEIADALGEPLGTVKTRLRLAMQKLRASADLAEMRPGAE